MMLRQLWCVVSTNMTCVVDVVAGSQHSDTQTVTRVGGDCDNEAWSAETLLGPALIMVTPAALLPQWESTQNIETETRDKWDTRQYSYTQLYQTIQRLPVIDNQISVEDDSANKWCGVQDDVHVE